MKASGRLLIAAMVFLIIVLWLANRADAAERPRASGTVTFNKVVSLTQTASKSGAGSGEVITFVLSVTNRGSKPLRDVTIRYLLPQEQVYVRRSSRPYYEVLENQPTWPAVRLAPGKSWSITLRVMILTTAKTRLTNELRVFTGVERLLAKQRISYAANP